MGGAGRRLKKLFIEETSDTKLQFFRYIFVGGAAFAVDAAALWALSFVMHYLLASAAAFVIGLLANYFLSKLLVFTERRINAFAEFAAYAVIGVIGLGLTELLMYIFTEKAGFYFMVSKIVTAAIVLAWNFGARKVLLYRSGK